MKIPVMDRIRRVDRLSRATLKAGMDEKTNRKRAHEALAYIGHLYRVEERKTKAYEEENEVSKEERVRYQWDVRREESRAILDQFKE